MQNFVDTLPPELRTKYLTQVKVRRSELEKFLDRCARAQATPKEYQEAQSCAHKLHGTGKTYGYPEITDAARALEHALDKNLKSPTLAPYIRAVIEACADALQPSSEMRSLDHAPTPKTRNLHKKIALKKPSGPAPPDLLPLGAVKTRSISKKSKAKKPMVLIADDDPSVAELLQQLLGADAEIIVAENGKLALAKIEEHKPALVILDDNMPEMTGAELLQKFSKSNHASATQIVMLTSNREMSDIIKGISAGAIDYILKPFDSVKLAQHIQRLLNHLGKKILVADDDAAVRSLLLHKFRKLGFHVLQAEDGQDALTMVIEERPDLIILDRMMPGMDGLAILRTLRAHENLHDTPVILLTAKRQNKDVVEGFDAGATDYVVKPFMPDEVVARALRRLNQKGPKEA